MASGYTAETSAVSAYNTSIKFRIRWETSQYNAERKWIVKMWLQGNNVGANYTNTGWTFQPKIGGTTYGSKTNSPSLSTGGNHWTDIYTSADQRIIDEADVNTLSIGLHYYGRPTQEPNHAQITVEGNATLDALTTIGPCSITSISPQEINFGQEATVSISRGANAQYVGITYTLSSQSATHYYNLGTGSSPSVQWTLPSGWASVMGQQTTMMAGSATITTYTDSSHTTSVGSSYYYWFAKPVSTSPPTILTGGLSYGMMWTDGTVRGWHVGLARYTEVYCVFDKSKIQLADAYTSISQYSLQIGGATYTSAPAQNSDTTSIISPIIMTPGTYTVTYTVRDSNGKSTSETSTVTIYPYSSPTLHDVSIYRCDSVGIATGNGAYISVIASGECSSAGGNNRFDLYYRYRASGQSWPTHVVGGETEDWWGSLTDGTRSILDGTEFGGVGISADTAYDVEVMVVDALGNSSTAAEQVPGRVVTFNALDHNLGVAFGKMASRNNYVDSAWSIRTDHNLDVLGSIASPNLVAGKITVIAQGGTSQIQFASAMAGVPTVIIAQNQYNHALALQNVTVNGFEVAYNSHSYSDFEVPYIAIYCGRTIS